MPPAVVVIVVLGPIIPIAIPIDDELSKPVQLLPLTPAIVLFAIVRALDAVPVPTVIPRPPSPPVLVERALVILFVVTDDETKPVSSEIPTGADAALD